MKVEQESSSENWKWAGGTFVLGGLWIGIRFLARGDIFAILGLLMLVCGVGLWLQQGWARWGTIGLCVTTSLFYGTMHLLDHTFGLTTVVMVGGSFYGAWYIWKGCRKPTLLESAKEKKPLVSLVLLLREPRYLEDRILAEIISSAWGEEYMTGEGDENSTRWVVGETPMFMANSPEGMFLINNFDRQYFDKMKEVLEHLAELRLGKAVEEHRAWLSVDWISLHDKTATQESVYPKIARLVAELAGPDCLALYQPESGRIRVWEEEVIQELRGPNYIEAFGASSKVPVIPVEEDDPRLKAAVEEARSRWAEFVEAFNKRDGENFSIKAPITVDDHCEFIWVAVDGLEPEYIHGTLGNEPVDLGDMKLGDRVEIPLKDMNDWAFSRKNEMFGLFTTKAISEIQKERKA